MEDLLKRLPGVEVDADGTVKAQGETVNKVLVDGKEFFLTVKSLVLSYFIVLLLTYLFRLLI